MMQRSRRFVSGHLGEPDGGTSEELGELMLEVTISLGECNDPT
jgi:hypothetical protein